MKMFYIFVLVILSVTWLIFVFQNIGVTSPAQYSFFTKANSGSSAGVIITTSLITIPMGALLVLWLKSSSDNNDI